MAVERVRTVQLSVRARYLQPEAFHRQANPLALRLKRALDLIVAIPLALLALPIILAAALMVKLISPGPAFFAQEREGLGGRRIRMWKIRTMVPDAEARLKQHFKANPRAKAEWQRYMKLRQDPRIVPHIGPLLRRFSLDELPQVWNVIKGEMSVVGPRPFPDYHLQEFSAEFRALRRQVLPGMTGLWQVAHRSNGDLKAQEEDDTYYICNWSLWLDLWILVRTVPAVIGSNGAY